MNPRLIAIAGPLQGRTFTLDQEDFLMGRDLSNNLSISDPLISRRHNIIRYQAGKYSIIDLNSANGTFVNGVPMREHALGHGDLIAVGDSIFTFLIHKDETSEPYNSLSLTDDKLDSQSTIVLREEEVRYLHPEKALDMLPPTVRLAHDLNAILKISMEINSIRGLEELEQRLLESIFEVVPAERGAIVLTKPGSIEMASVLERTRFVEPSRPVRLSRTIANQVLNDGISILNNDVLESEAYNSVESLAIPKINSVLAVPLRVLDRVIGLIYMSSSVPMIRFNEEHLQLVTAIASMAAGALDNAQRLKWLESENRRLQEDINIEHEMVGESPRIREVYQSISRVARTDSTILIRGESGTGKELVARAIHFNSSRAGKPFMAINCAALTESLLESELFGHEKGSFTGAIAQKKGKLEVADCGTVFLDEMGELAPHLQATLLRVLQEQEFQRVGGTRSIKVDVRLIAATNRNLEQAIKDGSFRQDLYYRLNVVTISMPPLRQRREDIHLLASYFAKKYSQKCKRPIKGISPEARAILVSYNWPGNVRELENAIERAVVMGSTEILLPEDLPEALLDDTEAAAGSSAIKFYEAVHEAKRRIILNTLEQVSWNHNEAAKMLGVHPNNLHRLIRSLNIKIEHKK